LTIVPAGSDDAAVAAPEVVFKELSTLVDVR